MENVFLVLILLILSYLVYRISKPANLEKEFFLKYNNKTYHILSSTGIGLDLTNWENFLDLVEIKNFFEWYDKLLGIENLIVDVKERTENVLTITFVSDNKVEIWKPKSIEANDLLGIIQEAMLFMKEYTRGMTADSV